MFIVAPSGITKPAITLGAPNSSVAVRIVDSEMNDVAQGEIGEIVYRGTGLMSGYWHNDDATAATFRVPETEIPKTGGKKRWGALAGKWVRPEIWRDLNEMDVMSRATVWRTLRIVVTDRLFSVSCARASMVTSASVRSGSSSSRPRNMF